jgi:hypothetical protein
MAMRIHENCVVSGKVDNTQKGRVEVELVFTTGSRLRGVFAGNAHRDLAGRKLSFKHPAPDSNESIPEGLTLAHTGSTGDITASKRVRVPTVPMSEVHKYYKSGKELPTVLKNSLYLEWFSDTNGRVVLETSEFEFTAGCALWEMTIEEDAAAQQASAESLEGWFDRVCDLKKERQPKSYVETNEEMDEYQWEQFMRSSDRITDRYEELIDKFGMENDEEIDKHMGWNKPKVSEGEMLDVDAANQGFLELSASDDWKDDQERNHPILDKAHAILNEINHEDAATSDLWGACATLTAKLAGALSSYMEDDDMLMDKGFTIAQLKRCLKHIDTAVAEAGKSSPDQIQPLLLIRQDVIDLQNKLRGE